MHNDSNADGEIYAALEPVLTFGFQSHILITEIMPLKFEHQTNEWYQRLSITSCEPAVEIDNYDSFYSASVLCMGGEGGAGTSWVLETIRLGMKVLG